MLILHLVKVVQKGDHLLYIQVNHYSIVVVWAILNNQEKYPEDIFYRCLTLPKIDTGLVSEY